MSITIIPPEEILRREKRILTKEKERKGIVDIDTYNRLKGLLDTSKVVIDRVPLLGAKKIDIETINHLESLTDNAISILENINITDVPKRIPIKRTSQEIDKVMKGMRNRLGRASKLVKDCDPRSIQAMSEVSRYTEEYRDLSSEPDYRKLLRESEKLKRFFIDLCECKPLLSRWRRNS